MASSRKTGTNEAGWWSSGPWQVGTVDEYGTGRNYTNLAAWESDTDVDLVTAQVSPVLEVYGDSYDTSGASWTLNSATCDGSYFRIIRPAAGNFLNTGPITTKHFISSTTTGATFIISETYSQIQDIVATGDCNGTTARYLFYVNSTTEGAYVGCVAIDWTNSGSGGASGFGQYCSGSSSKNFVINCVAHNCKTSGFSQTYSSSSNLYAYNCTAVGNGAYGFDGSSSTYCHLKNCGACGNTTDDIESGQFDLTTCSESTPTWDSGTDNFHLASGDTTWKDQGTDLSSDSVYAFDDDVDFDTRSGSWDIGSDEADTGTTNYKSVYGEMPAASGGTVRQINKLLAGSFPAMSAGIVRDINKILVGNVPAMSGNITKETSKILVGSLPAGSGSVESEMVFMQEVSGSFPNPVGSLSHTVSFLTSLSGVFGSITGTITKSISKPLVGNMPQSTGGIVKQTQTTKTGNVPNPTGVAQGAVTLQKSVEGVFGTIAGLVSTILNPVTAPITKRIKILGSSVKKIFMG